MKAIKKWLMDKEGVFIVITWWVILFIIFTIMLGTSINNVNKNLQITSVTSKEFIQEAITTGVTLPYNENVSSASGKYDEENNQYLLQINEYNLYSTSEYEGTVSLDGDAKAVADIKLDVEVIEVYSVIYNYSLKTVEIKLVKTKTEPTSGFKATIKATPSGELHILWNGEDTGVIYTEGSKIEFAREEDNLVINGNVTEVSFYKDNKAPKYKEKDSEEQAKTIDFELVVEYSINSKSYTKANVSYQDLNDKEKEVVEEAVVFFTQMVEDSVGISKSAFTLLIVSSVVEVLLLGFGVFGIIALKKSKEE